MGVVFYNTLPGIGMGWDQSSVGVGGAEFF